MGYSWGGFESLILRSSAARYRTATQWPWEGPLLRIHAGLEHPEDMIADLEAGFARLRAVNPLPAQV
jgi:cystathionine beta-lyase